MEIGESSKTLMMTSTLVQEVAASLLLSSFDVLTFSLLSERKVILDMIMFFWCSMETTPYIKLVYLWSLFTSFWLLSA
jgi:hypothetical protein